MHTAYHFAVCAQAHFAYLTPREAIVSICVSDTAHEDDYLLYSGHVSDPDDDGSNV